MNEPCDLDFSSWEEQLRAHGGDVSEGLRSRVFQSVEKELERGAENGSLTSLGWMIAGLAWLNLSLGIVQLSEWRPLVNVDDRVLARRSDGEILPSIDVDMRKSLEAWP